MPPRPDRSDTDVVGRRAAAQIIDLFLVFVVFTLSLVGSSALPGPDGAPSLGWLLAVGLGYCGLLEGVWNGQTVGKRLVGIRVVMDTGEPVGPGAAIVRNLPVVVSYGLVGYLVALAAMASSDRRQRLFDSVARTVVVGSEFDSSVESSPYSG